MPGEQSEAREQTKQIEQNHPLVLEVEKEARRAGPGLKPREEDLVESNRNQSGESDPEGMMMKHGHPEKGEPEQNEIDRDP
jgi:hypothetical protein